VATCQWAGGGGGSTSFPLTHTEQIDECFGARVVAVKREISISKKGKYATRLMRKWTIVEGNNTRCDGGDSYDNDDRRVGGNNETMKVGEMAGFLDDKSTLDSSLRVV
jgi:hypothetical protein